MAQAFESRVKVVGIGSLDDGAALRDFVSRHGLSAFPHAADEDGALRSRLGVRGQPTWIFVDAEGNTDKVFGELGTGQLTSRLEALAGPPDAS